MSRLQSLSSREGTSQVSTRRKFTKKAYDAFVHQVGLQTLWLDELHLVRPYQQEPDLARLEFSVARRHQIRADGGFDIYLKLTVNFFPPDSDETSQADPDADLADGQSEPLMHIEVVYGAAYATEVEATEPMLEYFSKSSAQLTLWPYLRETLQSTLLRAGQEGFVLPVYSPFL